MAAGKRERTRSRADEAALAVPQDLMGAPGYVARRLYQAYLAIWVRTVDSTVTGPQFAVLVAVDKHPGEDQGSLALVAALDWSTMADVVRRLEKRGLVVRRPAEHDGRRKLLYLTDEGKQVLVEVNRRARELDKLLLPDWSEARRRRWLDELYEVAGHWESLVED
jgi:DNA-binding MarR family transcriptional regulator